DSRCEDDHAVAIRSAALVRNAMNRYAIIEAPSILGLKPTGVDRLPTVVLQHGLADELHARRAGRVVPTAAYDTERDPESLTLNARGIAEYSVRLADTVA